MVRSAAELHVSNHGVAAILRDHAERSGIEGRNASFDLTFVFIIDPDGERHNPPLDRRNRLADYGFSSLRASCSAAI